MGKDLVRVGVEQKGLRWTNHIWPLERTKEGANCTESSTGYLWGAGTTRPYRGICSQLKYFPIYLPWENRSPGRKRKGGRPAGGRQHGGMGGGRGVSRRMEPERCRSRKDEGSTTVREGLGHGTGSGDPCVSWSRDLKIPPKCLMGVMPPKSNLKYPIPRTGFPLVQIRTCPQPKTPNPTPQRGHFEAITQKKGRGKKRKQRKEKNNPRRFPRRSIGVLHRRSYLRAVFIRFLRRQRYLHCLRQKPWAEFKFIFT